MKEITVLVVDDQRLVREGIASLLSIQEGIKVIGMAVNGQEAIEQGEGIPYDVMLTDIKMVGVDNSRQR